jgi:hypothetical protein
MSESEELIKAGAEAFFRPWGDLLQKLAGPFCEEIGLMFGDAAREFRRVRAEKLFAKVNQKLAVAGYRPSAVPPKILFKVLDHASIEDDDYLHDRWAALLANASTPGESDRIKPSFPEILAQLSSQEVKLLDSILNHVMDNLEKHHADFPKTGNWAYLVDVGTWKTVLRIYAKKGLSRFPASTLTDVPKNARSREISEDTARFRVIFENLMRLGLIKEVQTKSQTTPVVHLTALGFDFVLACRFPQRESTPKQRKRPGRSIAGA